MLCRIIIEVRFTFVDSIKLRKAKVGNISTTLNIIPDMIQKLGSLASD